MFAQRVGLLLTMSGLVLLLLWLIPVFSVSAKPYEQPLLPNTTVLTNTSVPATASVVPLGAGLVAEDGFVSSDIRLASDWLAYLNEYRAMANLPPVTENTVWTDGLEKHARYMVKNDYIGHDEDPNEAWYTPEGKEAAQKSNVMVHGNMNLPDDAAIDMWMSGPFHGLGIIDPRLQQVAFGTYREAIGSYRMAAALDVIRGLGSVPAGVPYPVLWPADGKSVPIGSYSGNESPDPLTSCPGYQAPSGLPIVIQLDQKPDVGASFFRQGNEDLEHCIFDETSYSNPNSMLQNLGRQVLEMRHAIVLIPREPLTANRAYTASVETNGQTSIWTFCYGICEDIPTATPMATPTPMVYPTATPTNSPLPTSTPTPVPPPVAPSNVTAKSGVDSILLTWDASPSVHTTGYSIYRKTEGETDFSRIGDTSIATTAYHDTTIRNGVVYTYMVTAIDRTGQESSFALVSEPIQAGLLHISIPEIYAKPGTMVAVPVYIENSDNLCIDDMDIGIQYNPQIASATGVTNTVLTHDYTFVATTRWPDVYDPYTSPYWAGGPVEEVHITTSGECDTLRGPGALFWVYFSVSPTAQVDSSLDFVRGTTVLYNKNNGSNGDPPVFLPLMLDDAHGHILIAPEGKYILGDLNANGVVEQEWAEDAVIALGLATSAISSTTSHMAAGDINGDRRVDAADATMILHYGRHRAWPTIEHTVPIFRAEEMVNTFVVAPATVAGAVGDVVTVPITLSSGVDVAGGTMLVRYGDGLALAATTPVQSEHVMAYHPVSQGVLGLSLAATRVLTSGMQTLAEVRFDVLDDATEESTWMVVGDVSLNDGVGRDFALSVLEREVVGGTGLVTLDATTEGIPEDETTGPPKVYLPLIQR